MSEKKSGVKCTEDKAAREKNAIFSNKKAIFLSAIERGSDFCCTWWNVKRM